MTDKRTAATDKRTAATDKRTNATDKITAATNKRTDEIMSGLFLKRENCSSLFILGMKK